MIISTVPNGYNTLIGFYKVKSIPKDHETAYLAVSIENHPKFYLPNTEKIVQFTLDGFQPFIITLNISNFMYNQVEI